MSPEELFRDNQPLTSYVLRTKFNSIKPHSSFNLEDLQQTAYLGLWKASRTFDSTKGFSFSTYAVRVIYNEVACLLRLTNKYTFVESDYLRPSSEDSGPMSLENTLLLGELPEYPGLIKEDLKATVSKLSTKERRLLQLLPKYTQTEIAKLLGHSQPQVSRLIRQLRTKLRRLVD